MCHILNKKIHWLLITALLLSLPLPSAAAEKLTAQELAVTINLAGKQRMLSQKMTKEAVLLYMGYQPAQTGQALEDSATLFQKTLRGLQQGDADLKLVALEKKRIQRQAEKVMRLWRPFQNHIDKLLAKHKGGEAILVDDVKYLVANNLQLLKQMNRLVRLYEKEGKGSSNADLATTINLAGKQRMLSQKLAKDYFIIKAGLSSADVIKELKLTSNLFSRTLHGLEHGDKTLGLVGTDIAPANAQLAVVKTIWQDFEPRYLAASKDGVINAADFEFVAANNLKLLAAMNKAVSLYENELR